MSDGFGASFWGFFVVATVWCIAYFVWAVRANRREAGPRSNRHSNGRRDDRGGDSGAPTPASHGGGAGRPNSSSTDATRREE